jgi:hypothetical protein
MRTEERFIPDGDRMRVVVTHHDPLYYEKLVVTYPYQRLPGGEILPWDCTTEEANDKAQCSRPLVACFLLCVDD